MTNTALLHDIATCDSFFEYTERSVEYTERSADTVRGPLPFYDEISVMLMTRKLTSILRSLLKKVRRGMDLTAEMDAVVRKHLDRLESINEKIIIAGQPSNVFIKITYSEINNSIGIMKDILFANFYNSDTFRKISDEAAVEIETDEGIQKALREIGYKHKSTSANCI